MAELVQEFDRLKGVQHQFLLKILCQHRGDYLTSHLLLVELDQLSV